MSALLTFLGGSAFRMLWGEASAWLKARQDHKHELELMRLQADLDAQRFEQQQAAIKLQADLGIKTIQVKADADLALEDARGFYAATLQAGQPTGIKLVDGWNGIIRPLCATVAVILWVRALNAQGWAMTDWDQQLVGVILGFFFANRVLGQRGN